MEALTGQASAWGIASLPLPGEWESGDSFVVTKTDRGSLVAMIDALGHGRDAARAARVAAGALESYAHETPEALFRRCDELMRGTRGAAMSLAAIDREGRTLTWLGVGNVTGVLVLADPGAHPRVRQLLVRSGVVGFQLPELHPSVMPAAPSDILVLATDGVHGNFMDLLPSTLDPQPLAERILEGYATRNDDALVVVFPCGAAP